MNSREHYFEQQQNLRFLILVNKKYVSLKKELSLLKKMHWALAYCVLQLKKKNIQMTKNISLNAINLCLKHYFTK